MLLRVPLCRAMVAIGLFCLSPGLTGCRKKTTVQTDGTATPVATSTDGTSSQPVEQEPPKKKKSKPPKSSSGSGKKFLGELAKHGAGMIPGGAGVPVSAIASEAIAYMEKRDASKAEQQRAATEAAQVNQRSDAAHLRELRDQSGTEYYAVRANDEGGRMIVNADTGQPVNNKVYKIDESETQQKPVARLDDYDVVMVN